MPACCAPLAGARMRVEGGVAARGISRGLRHPPAQGFALRSNEHVRLRLPCPCRRSPLVWPGGSLRKALLLSLLRRGANGGITMKDLNRVQLIGHLGHDPEVTYTATGTARTTFSVATSTRWKDADGQVQEATEWTHCIAWGTLAEVCATYVTAELAYVWRSSGHRPRRAGGSPPRHAARDAAL